VANGELASSLRDTGVMAMLVLQFAILALLIVGAGTLLCRTADEIGRLTSLGRTLAGFFLLAGATSLPELAIDCNAALIEAADLALGDLLGSSIFNLIILGVIDLTHRNSVRILSPISAAHALSATASIVLTGLVLVSIMPPNDPEFLRVGTSL
jgi:cation:H+ antiporter